MRDACDVIDPHSIDVLVVDDHRVFGDAMSIAVNAQGDMRCRGAATSAEEALEWCRERCPQVVLLDIGLPGMDGITAIGALRSLCPRVRTILVTADVSGQTVVEAVEAGADGFLPKSHPFGEVLDAVRRVDQDLIAERLSLRRALDRIGDGDGVADIEPPALTDREHEILLLLADGMPVKQVARRLGMTVNTCRGHVASLLRKLDAHSQLAAVITAARLGMLPNLRADGHANASPPRPPPPY